jgi:hypothetical protein
MQLLYDQRVLYVLIIFNKRKYLTATSSVSYVWRLGVVLAALRVFKVILRVLKSS